MTGHVQKRVDRRDGQALGTRLDLHDFVTGFDLSLLEAKVEAWSAVRDQQGGRLRIVYVDPDDSR